MRIRLGRPCLMKQIAHASRGELILTEDASCLQAVTHLTTDTRELEKGDLFVALRGKHDDGHRYVSLASKMGASAVMCDTTYGRTDRLCCRIACRDTFSALLAFATDYASMIPHRTIAVTGSVGKTTTRRYLSSVLGQKYRVHESPDNYNNLLGTALTLLTMPPETDFLVSECGMSAEGEIAAMSECLKPDYAVITNIGVSHLEYLGTREAICRAKLEICCGMHGGNLLIEGGDSLLADLAPGDALTVSATLADAACHAGGISYDGHGVWFDYCSPTRILYHLRLPAVGRHNLSCAMFAVTVASLLGMKEEDIRTGLMHFRAEQMRQTVMSAGRVQLLIDCYNACPESMMAACDALQLIAEDGCGNTYALLGDMSELGTESQHLHFEVGKYFAKHGLDGLIAVGDMAPIYADGALFGGMTDKQILTLPAGTDSDTVAKVVSARLSPHDILLIKGSRAARLEQYTPALAATLSALG